MKKLLVLSGKGGTGKTTLTAAFIRFAASRAYADCDVDAPNLHILVNPQHKPSTSDYLGMQIAHIDPQRCTGGGKCISACYADAIHKVDSVCAVDEYACEGCGVCAYVCPQDALSFRDNVVGQLKLYHDEHIFSTAQLKMGQGNSGKLVCAVKSALDDAVENTAYNGLEIIDGSPGIGCPVIASVGGVDMVIVVAEPSVSGISDMERILGVANTLGVKMAVCVNKYDVSPQLTCDIEEHCKNNNILFAGKIPYDKMAVDAINKGKSIVDIDCPATFALREVFDTVMASLQV